MFVTALSTESIALCLNTVVDYRHLSECDVQIVTWGGHMISGVLKQLAAITSNMHN